MAMTYTEAAQLKNNPWFVQRVDVATSTYANYLLNTPVADPEYAEKINAGTRLCRESAMVSQTLMATLIGDAEIQAAGPCIADAQLQMIVEKTIVKFYPVQVAPAGMMYGPPAYAPSIPPPRQ
jgi:hypothetical protein